MPTIVKHNPTAKHYILLGAGFAQWSTARPNRILGDLFPTENAAQTRLLCLCDEHGKVEWALDDQVTIIQTDTQSPAQILANFPNSDPSPNA